MISFSSRLATEIVDWLCMFVSVDLLKFNELIIKVAANVIVVVLNYVARKSFIFKKKKMRENIMENTLVSIVIPVYNVEKYLKKCIESVLNQTYKNIQIILVNDGSTDNSPALCDEYKQMYDKVEVIHKSNGGLPDARNAGLKRAKGEYVGFIDSDDWIEPNMVEHLLHNIIEYDADISSVELQKVQEETELEQKPCKIECFSQEEYAKKFFKIGSQKIVHYICNKLFKRQILDDNTFEKEFSIGEDVVAFCKILLKANKVVSSNQIMYYYRQNTGMTAKFNDRYFGLERVWERVNEIVHAASAEHYYPYVEINQARINFTILTEIAVAGENNNPKYKKRIDYYLQKLKSNKKMLLKSGVALNRKIMIWLACTNYGIYSKLIYRLTRK